MPATKVKVLGFKFELAKHIEIADFFQSLESFEDKEIKYFDRLLVPYFDIKENYIIGAVLSLRDDKLSIASSRDSKGNLTVNTNELASDQQKTEVALFCINPATCRGLLYTYYGSISTTSLYHLFNKAHRKLKNQKVIGMANELSDLGKRGEKKKYKEKAKSHFAGDFNLTVLMKQTSLARALKEFKKVNLYEVAFSEALPKTGLFTPADPFCSKSKLTSYMDRSANITAVKNALKEALTPLSKNNAVDSIKLQGKGLGGNDLALFVGENMDEFENLNYDRYLQLLPTGLWKDYINCGAINILLNIIKDKDVIFGQQPTDTSWKLLSAKDIPK